MNNQNSFRQLTLPVSWEFSCKPDDFIITKCNEYAYRWLEKWPFSIDENFVCLVGEHGSGKSHMSKIWAYRLGADIIDAENDIVFDKWFDMSNNDNNQKYFVLENADSIKDDIILFYIYNTIKEKSAYLLITAKTPPSLWNIKLKDTISRLKTISVININQPDEESFSQIIKKVLVRRGFNPQDNVIQYISNNIERTYESIDSYVKKLDTNLSSKDKLTISNIKNIA